MTQFYLITGFLGAGKTTFLQGFLPQLNGQNVKLIINEFGNHGVDGSLLQSTNTHLQEICGGSIFCSCKLDRFEEAMNDCLATTPDVIVVEASGLSDPTNIRKVLCQYEQAGKLDYKGCICLVDAVRFHKVFATARVVKRQLAVADLVIVNKTDLVDDQQVQALQTSVQEQFPFARFEQASFGRVPIDLQALQRPCTEQYDAQADRPDITLQKMTIAIDPTMTLYQLERFLHLFAEDTARIKGYTTVAEGLALVDCVGGMVTVNIVPDQVVSQGINLLATQGQPMRKTLKTAITHYPTMVSIIK